MNSSPQTLTSHIPIINKRKMEGSAKKHSSKNGNAGYDTRTNDRNRTSRNEKNRQNGLTGKNAPRTGFPGKNRRVAAMKGERPASPSERNPLPSREKGKGRTTGIEPFDLFCAYHLGIGPNKQYKPSNINEVANRFGFDPASIRQTLKEYGMDSASLLDRDFDMALAQLDIQVAPEGVDRKELAKTIYAEFLEAPYKKRDWKKLLEEDRRENRKIFGGS